jgi:two-component system, NarL family, sensor histidine kinase DesK
METEQPKHRGSRRWSALLASRGPQTDAVIAESGLSFHLWRLYQHFWLVCLLFPLVHLVRDHLSLLQLITGLGALVFFSASYTWLMWRHPIERGMHGRSRTHLQLVLWLVLVALALVLSLTCGLSFLWLFVGVSAIAGVLFPLRRAFMVVSLLMFLPPVLSVILSGGVTEVDWVATIALMLLVRALGLDMLGLVHLSKAIRELHATRKELARLSVEEERQRLSRDLHDLLGQTLSVITLKSELARGLVQEEPERCAQELAEIEHVSRQMLREVRKTVAGYRQPTLANELDGARQLLEAAGVEYVVEQTVGDLLPTLDVILAWTIREGVTNVIRHSRARQCLIQLIRNQGMAEALILNDGDCQEDQQGKRMNQGNGLSGLRERVATLGGTMEAGSLDVSGKQHFRLWVALPLQSGAEAGGVQEKRA